MRRSTTATTTTAAATATTTTTTPEVVMASEEGIGRVLTKVVFASETTNNHRWSASKSSKNQKRARVATKFCFCRGYLKVFAGIGLLTLLTMYIMMTRHVLLHSSSSSSSSMTSSMTMGGMGIEMEMGMKMVVQSEPFYTNRTRVLYEPVGLFFGTSTSTKKKKQQQQYPISNHGLDVSSCCLSKKPLMVGYYFSTADPLSFVGQERLNPNLLTRSLDNSKARIRRNLMTQKELDRQIALKDSDDYRDGAADTIQSQGKDCVAQYDWQESFFPTCNFLMEADVTHLLPDLERHDYSVVVGEKKQGSSRNGTTVSPLHLFLGLSSPTMVLSTTEVRLISNGYWRDVWKIETNRNGPKEFSETYVLKTMRYKHEYVPRNFDRHRRDAVAMERLSSSPYIMNIYASCGNSGLFEYADGGSLEDSIWRDKDDVTTPWTSEERLVVAYQTAAGVADLHNVGKEGVPSIAHTDITPGQFVYVDEAGVYKLNDFNRARFIGWNKRTNATCSFRVGSNPGRVSG
jgi:hypothetical protein